MGRVLLFHLLVFSLQLLHVGLMLHALLHGRLGLRVALRDAAFPLFHLSVDAGNLLGLLASQAGDALLVTEGLALVVAQVDVVGFVAEEVTVAVEEFGVAMVVVALLPFPPEEEEVVAVVVVEVQAEPNCYSLLLQRNHPYDPVDLHCIVPVDIAAPAPAAAADDVDVNSQHRIQAVPSYYSMHPIGLVSVPFEIVVVQLFGVDVAPCCSRCWWWHYQHYFHHLPSSSN